MYPSDSCNVDRSEDRLTASHEATEKQSTFRFVRTDEILAVVFIDRAKSRELKKELTKNYKATETKISTTQAVHSRKTSREVKKAEFDLVTKAPSSD